MASQFIERLRNSIGLEMGDIEKSNPQDRPDMLRDYMSTRNLKRATLSTKDLQELTDVQFFMSKNFLNLVSFVMVLSVSFCLGWNGWGRDVKGSFKDIQDQYQTIFTPVFWSQGLWLLIFALEAVFVVFQFLPKFQHSPLVERTVGWYFFLVNCCQTAWIISYCFDTISVATLFMAGNVLALTILNINLYNCDWLDSPAGRREALATSDFGRMDMVYEFLAFRLPFQIHLGWAIFIFLVNLHEIIFSRKTPYQHYIALGSCILLWVIGIVLLFVPTHPNFIVPLVFSWASMGLWVKLHNPNEIIESYKEINSDASFSDVDLGRMTNAAIATCIEHLVLPMIRFLFHFAENYSLMEREVN